ncbi:MAG: hypothetical protein IPJ43_12920 [Saprospiraceae bacterium]|nr:hypothetical protein [Saprospiraceae bacterium]
MKDAIGKLKADIEIDPEPVSESQKISLPMLVVSHTMLGGAMVILFSLCIPLWSSSDAALSQM